jgi:outer membrane phospholipase A
MNGRIVLQLERLSAPPVVIEVDDAKAEAAAKAAEAKAAEEKAAEAKAAESKAPDSTTTDKNTAESNPAGAVPPPAQSTSQPTPPSGAQPVAQANLEPGELPGQATEEPPIPIAEHTPQRFSAHEPIYFVVGDRPSARFQFSFKYQFIDPESQWGAKHPFISSLRFAYTQTSLWDLAASSQPFTDSSYKPELFFSIDKLDGVSFFDTKQVGLQAGFAHESNGRDGDDSRGINTLFVEPVLFWGEEKDFHLRVKPKVYVYVSDNEGNKDIADYRGFVDMRVIVGKVDGFELSAMGRLGRDFDKGSLQLDATYPLQALGQGTFDLYLQGQFFTGYGESLLTYNQYTQSLRFGIGLSR